MSFLEAEEFQRKKGLERIQKDEMKAIIEKENAKGVAGLAKARAEGRSGTKPNPDYYEDEYTTGEKETEELNEKEVEGFGEEDYPNDEEEFEPAEPDDDGIAVEAKPKQETIMPNKKIEAKPETQTLTAEQIYEQGVNAGIAIGYKRARLEVIEKLMG